MTECGAQEDGAGGKATKFLRYGHEVEGYVPQGIGALAKDKVGRVEAVNRPFWFKNPKTDAKRPYEFSWPPPGMRPVSSLTIWRPEDSWPSY
jgi:hypothetical protein